MKKEKNILLAYKQFKEGMQHLNELTPLYDARGSFYGKALIINDDNYAVLLSYYTPVMVIDLKNSRFCFNNDVDYDLLFSNTTLRHIKETLKQYLDARLDFIKKGFDSVIYSSGNKKMKKYYDPSLQYLF